MNRMARYQLLANHENDDDVPAGQRLAMFRREMAARARIGNDDIMASFLNARAGGVREARCERVTVHGSTLRYSAYLLSTFVQFCSCAHRAGEAVLCLTCSMRVVTESVGYCEYHYCLSCIGLSDICNPTFARRHCPVLI